MGGSTAEDAGFATGFGGLTLYRSHQNSRAIAIPTSKQTPKMMCDFFILDLQLLKEVEDL